jgi:phage head maturation protease
MARKKDDKPKAEYELRDLDIFEVSVVDEPAVPGALFALRKSETGFDDLQELKAHFVIEKVNKKQKIVAGYALVANEADLHGDIVYEEELEKAAGSFLRNMAHHWQWGTGTGEQHYKYTGVGWPIESVIDRNGSIARYHKVKPKPGSWWLRVKITDDDVWAKIESGEITGFSIAGMARRIAIDDDDDDDKAKRASKSGLVEFVKRSKDAGIENVAELLRSFLSDEYADELEQIETKEEDSGESTIQSSTEGGTDVDETQVRAIVREEFGTLKTALETSLNETLATTVADAIKALKPNGGTETPPDGGGKEGEKKTEKSGDDDGVAKAIEKLQLSVDGIRTDVDAIKRSPAGGRAGLPADDVHGVEAGDGGTTVIPIRKDGSGKPDYSKMVGKGAFELGAPDVKFVETDEDGNPVEGATDGDEEGNEDDPPA